MLSSCSTSLSCVLPSVAVVLALLLPCVSAEDYIVREYSDCDSFYFNSDYLNEYTDGSGECVVDTRLPSPAVAYTMRDIGYVDFRLFADMKCTHRIQDGFLLIMHDECESSTSIPSAGFAAEQIGLDLWTMIGIVCAVMLVPVAAVLTIWLIKESRNPSPVAPAVRQEMATSQQLRQGPPPGIAPPPSYEEAMLVRRVSSLGQSMTRHSSTASAPPDLSAPLLYQEQPAAAAVADAVPQDQWLFPLFDCASVGEFCEALLCTPCSVADVRRRMYDFSDRRCAFEALGMLMVDLALCLVLFGIVLPMTSVVAMLARVDMRQRRGYAGSPFEDAVCAFCCTACVVHQMSRDQEYYEVALDQLDTPPVAATMQQPQLAASADKPRAASRSTSRKGSRRRRSRSGSGGGSGSGSGDGSRSGSGGADVEATAPPVDDTVGIAAAGDAGPAL